jgi:uncharacterized protein
MNNYTKKYFLLLEKLHAKDKIAVAFSGGTDSTLVAYAAKEAGISVMLITLKSPLFSAYDEKIAKQIAHDLEIRHIIVSENLNNKVSKNKIMRCYYCKSDEAKTCKDVARQHGFSIVADGTNYDDIKDKKRPGVIASSEYGIWHPLAEVKINKIEGRNILKEKGLSVWNRPSNACLASRIMYEEEITLDKLTRIEKAEDFLREISPQVRVRLHKNISRIEVPIEFLNDILQMRGEIVEYMKKIGFIYITLDLEGFRSGSMHEGMEK